MSFELSGNQAVHAHNEICLGHGCFGMADYGCTLSIRVEGMAVNDEIFATFCESCAHEQKQLGNATNLEKL